MRLNKVLLGAVEGGLLALLLGVTAWVVLFFQVASTLPQLPEDLGAVFISQPTEIYATSPGGEAILIATLGGRTRVPLDRIAQSFQNAILAIEDTDFYQHHGLNKRRLVLALLTNLRRMSLVAQGASTITQQLAKNLFFSFEKRWVRKFKEVLMATQIESTFSKKEILEAYCNYIFFGANSYGIEAAAQAYFGKHADELSLAEAAMLAGLVQSPSRYNPYVHWQRAKRRQAVVLNRMVICGMISEAEREAALAEPLQLKQLTVGTQVGPYFLDYVKQIAIERYGEELVYYGGLRIFTPLDLEMQKAAQQAVKEQLQALDARMGESIPFEQAAPAAKKDYLQAALVAIEPQTGAIRALVGGRDYGYSEYNRAVQNNRLPGSGFKPFIYLAALDKLGLTPATVVVDEPVTFRVPGSRPWSPKNFSRTHHGPMILKKALMNSVNVIAAKLIHQVGAATVIEYAHKLGIQSPLQPNLSLALGTAGVAPLEMASAYGVLASGGIYTPPIAITRVEDYRGRILDEWFIQGKQVVNPQSVYMLVDMMKGVVDQGTGAGVRRLGFTLPCAGKTGTTDDTRDAWFTGFTTNLSVSVWVGYDDNRSMRQKTGRELVGGTAGVPIWTAFMKRVLTREPVRDFVVPAGITFVEVDAVTGKTATAETSERLTVAVREGISSQQADPKDTADLTF